MKKILIILILVVLAVFVFVSLRPTEPEKNIEYIADGEIIRLLDKEKNVVFEYSIEEFRSWAKENWQDIFETPPAFGELREVDPENFYRFDNTASLSPDRDFLSFSVHDYAALTSISFICTINIETAEVKLVGKENIGSLQNLIWSPQGSHLAYVLDSARAQGDFLSVDNTEKMEKEFTLSGNEILNALTNPDHVGFMPHFRELGWIGGGERLGFTTDGLKEGEAFVWSIDVQGTDLKKETKSQTDKPSREQFIECLAEAGVVIYGSQTCPACFQLEQEYGGKAVIGPIYLDCSGLGSEEETKRCMEEMQTRYVPEIQIKGEFFEGWGSPEALAEVTGCTLWK